MKEITLHIRVKSMWELQDLMYHLHPYVRWCDGSCVVDSFGVRIPDLLVCDLGTFGYDELIIHYHLYQSKVSYSTRKDVLENIREDSRVITYKEFIIDYGCPIL